MPELGQAPAGDRTATRGSIDRGASPLHAYRIVVRASKRTVLRSGGGDGGIPVST